MSLKRVIALLKKELRDLRRNTSIVYIAVIPLLLTVIWSKLMGDSMPPQTSATMGTLFAVVMMSIYPPAMMIAEEKEKHTLRVLMLSPAKPGEILLSKGLVTLVATLLISVLVIAISGVQVANPVLFAIIVLLGTCSLVLVGFCVGLFAPNQMSTGTIGMPIYLIMLMIPTLSQHNATLRTIAKFIPSNYIGDGVFMAIKGATLGDARWQMGALALAIAIMAVVFIAAYRHKQLSEE